MRKMILALVAMMITVGATAQEGNQRQRGPRQFDRTEMIKQRTDNTVKQYVANGGAVGDEVKVLITPDGVALMIWQ